MRSTSARVIVVLAAVVAAVGLYVAFRGEDDDGDSVVNQPVTSTGKAGTPEPPAPPVIVVSNGEPVDGVAELDYQKGDRIQFVVRSDVDEQIHLHGYDVSKEIAAGGSVRFDLTADIEGVFEVELENSAVPIAEIKVAPA